jgi:hypothetical protein
MTAPQSDKCVQRLLSSLRALPPQKRDLRTMARNTRNKSTDSNGLNSFASSSWHSPLLPSGFVCGSHFRTSLWSALRLL